LGLGLAIARHLVEIHGGTIRAENNDDERGCKFCVRLPLIASLTKLRDGNGEIESADTQPVLAGLHVLVVDDDSDTLELLRMALTQRDAKVTAVGSTDEALEALRSVSPDVLVSDIAMPGSDGYDLIKAMRASDTSLRFVPAVAITAYAKEEDRERALASGFQHYVPKPVELSELIAAVAEAAGRNLSGAYLGKITDQNRN
jgi:CheY-like chemotaxis protein